MTMTTISRHRGSTGTSTDAPVESTQRQGFGTALGVLRLSLGWVFLWAFLDKLLALGFATGRDPKTGVVDRLGDAAWINGGSPTKGFLTFGTAGPLKDFYGSFAGTAWADWMFMIGLLGIGAALMLGIGMRIAMVAGVAMLVMMWSAYLPPDNNPFMDDHIIYALALVVMVGAGAGRHLGLGNAWNRLAVVRHHRWLR
jgi:thiosulfate dehydrogenase [quinone] large subunit